MTMKKASIHIHVLRSIYDTLSVCITSLFKRPSLMKSEIMMRAISTNFSNIL